MPFDSKQAGFEILKRRYAEASKRSVFFVGAGGSVEVGLPSWRKLATDLLKTVDAATPASALSDEILSAYHDAEILLSSNDLWGFFGAIERNWGTVYEDYLRGVFDPDKLERIDIPALYKKIWRMRNVNQVMTLNIDGLLSRAYSAVVTTGNPQLQEFPGMSVTDSRSYIDRNHPVILNLHGSYSHRSTWVMNESERTKLFTGFARGDYTSFVRHIFESFNVVFVGVNIRDRAISPIVEQVAQSGLLQDHFWITSSIGGEDYAWAQKNGVRVIDYTPEVSEDGSNSHSAVICSILDEIERHKSEDRPVQLPPRPLTVAAQGDEFPAANEIFEKFGADVVSMRSLIDAKIETISQADGFSSRPMENFIQNYATAIDVSSVVGVTPPYNSIEGVELNANMSGSNSSSVWIGTRVADGQPVAIKCLSGQAFKDRIERESFRRGVESLHHLNSVNSPVAPRYYFHTNTPLAVGMELIQGTSLADLMQSERFLVSQVWFDITLNLAMTLLSCHVSEAEVLHRDVKPRNVIIEGVYAGCDAQDLRHAKVRLINFDMSWHKFSAGNSKSVSADEVGFYAPEQRHFANSDSPRTAKTDVYMLGMTLLSLISDSVPPEGGSRLKDWEEHVIRKVNSGLDRDRLVALRVGRLIISMTSADPENRPDLQEAIAELAALRHPMDEIGVPPIRIFLLRSFYSKAAMTMIGIILGCLVRSLLHGR